MSRRRLCSAVLLTLAGVLQACASGPDRARPSDTGAEADSAIAADSALAAAAADAAAADAAECVTGTVILEGVQFAPRTWARSATGEYVELAGPAVANVRLLSGTTVRVCGPPPAPGGPLEVREVELLEVDRMPAVLGTLRETAARWAVEPLGGGEPVPLRDVPEAFAGAAGQVVWVAGELGDDGLAVRSYGVLEGWR